MSKKNKNSTPFQEIKLLSPDHSFTPDAFDWVGPDVEKQDAIARPSTSYGKDAMRRLRGNKTAMVCIVILVIIMLMAVIVPLASPYTISEQHLYHVNEGFMYDAGDHIHIFGTDTLGRDLFVRVFHGARTSLFIAYTAVFVNLLIGVIYGSFAGYLGALTDTVMMRVIEIVAGIPYLIVVIVMMMILPPGVWTMVVAYAVVGWIGMARLVRGQILGLKTQEYVVAARALGASAIRVMFRHLMPNLLSVVIVNITLAIPSAIFTEAFLSFIGMGVPIPEASWGTLAQEGVRYFQMYPSQLFLPAFFISITMLSFNLLGDGLRDAFDPRLRR